ncbi:MAG: hypothetical protein IKL14_01860 [Alphaproteobacteria bacterium]|nr:hypothetical protein [Alphaproteobacteria bacterium]
MKKIFTLIILIIISTSAHCNPDDILTYTKKYIAQHNDLDTLIETCNRIIKYADDSLVNIIINDTKYTKQYCADIKQIAKDNPHLGYLLQTELTDKIINFAFQINQHTSDPTDGCRFGQNIFYLVEQICYKKSDLSNYPYKERINCREEKKRKILAANEGRRVLVYEHLPDKQTFISCNLIDFKCDNVKNVTNIIVDGHISPSVYMFYPDCSIDTKKYPNYYLNPQKIRQYITELNQKHESVNRQDIFYNLPGKPQSQ